MGNGLLMLNTSTGNFLIDPGTIVRIEASSNYSKLYFSNGNTLLTAKVLKWFEERLPQQAFTRLHRSHLVNNGFLRSNQKTANAFELKNGKIIQVSRRRKKQVLLKFSLPPESFSLGKTMLLPPAC
ncbi:MAG TPA: LytTR family DNA-binding domain-containing protein [Ferruginibacter sp.]|jgi:two-component system LytT family response regulator|nr:LytTR family DNA-binding domain-containing protein [Ferruginibacter sp.]